VSGICDLVHPDLTAVSPSWDKWRLAYEGGLNFKTRFLKRVSLRESVDDFNDRQNMSYVPRFAATALDRVRDSLYMRFSEITRVGGSKSYQDAVIGLNNGVDLIGSSMNNFMGCHILPELLLMQFVGIYVDSPSLTGQETLAEVTGKAPYLYYFRVEEIRSWKCEEGPNNDEYSAVLLKECIYDQDEEYGLPSGLTYRFRYLFKEDGTVKLRYYDTAGAQIDGNGNPSGETYDLKVKRIPFILLRIKRSLMQDICDYQIALMNLASADLWYAIKANFPFYTEPYDPRTELMNRRQPPPDPNADTLAAGDTRPGMAAQAAVADNQEIKVGPTYGRKFPQGTERPGFIHPSSEPLLASMEKQKQMMAEIKMLVNLAVAENRPKQQSAESKGLDEVGLQAGLTYIGFLLQQAERKIAEYWAEYENSTDIPTVNYPEKYDIPNDSEITEEIERLTETMQTIPSLTYKKQVAKRIAKLIVEHDVEANVLDKINKEIDNAIAMISDPKDVASDVEHELVDRETASLARGWPKGSADKAKEEAKAKLEQLQASQMQNNEARGLPGADPQGAKKEKELSQDRNLAKDQSAPLTRGEGK